MIQYKQFRRILIFYILIFSFSISCNSDNSNQKIDNLVAFSKLYGYVRYFHPSDEAANTDWGAFVVNGVEKVKNARDNDELEVILKELFYPIAPTIQIYNNSENPKIPDYPKDTFGLKKIFWQHYGIDDDEPRNSYKSIRTNRNVENSNSSILCYRVLNDVEFQNCEIKFDLKLRTEFLNKESFFAIGMKGENFQDEQIDTVLVNGTCNASVKLKLEKNASPLYLGFQFIGQGKVIIDDAKLTMRRGNISKNIYLSNSGFEEYDATGSPKDWIIERQFYRYGANKLNPISGETSFLIENMNNDIKCAIFNNFPKSNEYFDKELISGLKCRVPLVLWSDSTDIIKGKMRYSNDPIRNNIDTLNHKIQYSIYNENTRLANVIITWNIIQHFFPYFEYLDVDWAELQKKSLELTFKDENAENIKNILVKMLEPLKDGHVNVYADESAESGVLPFIAEWIEDKAVITKSAITTFKSGDIINKVNEIPILDFIKEREKFITGSPQLKRTKCLNWGSLVEGKVGDPINILIERDGKLKRIDVELFSFDTIQKLQHDNLKPIRKLVDGIYYINIGIVSIPDIEQNLDELMKADGLIIDLREYPFDHEMSFFSYFSNTTIVTPSWFIPNIIYPDRDKFKFSFRNRNFIPNQIFLNCKKIFIFDSGTISLGEEYSSSVKYNNLGITIGQPTAGTNGEIIKYNLPGNLSFMFTGMKVLNVDSSQHYILGVQPDIFVNKTIKGVMAGKDEYIDKAIELLMK